jgi:thiol-disulfide isomerase/thioredoxin
LSALLLGTALLASLAGYEWFRQPPIQQAPPATIRESQIASAPALSVHAEPRPVPAIRFTDGDGRELTLADFRGRVVLLNIWATWCVPCRKEMPSLDRLEKQLDRKDFIVLPVSIDRKGLSVVKPFYEELGLASLGIYLDTSGSIQGALAVPGIPTTLLIDREGREVARKMGAAEWDSPEMVALIGRYLPPGGDNEGKQGQ